MSLLTDRVGVAPHKQRRSVDSFELGHVCVDEQVSEHRLPRPDEWGPFDDALITVLGLT